MKFLMHIAVFMILILGCADAEGSEKKIEKPSYVTFSLTQNTISEKAFVLPLLNEVIPINSQLFLSHKGKQINAKFSTVIRWPYVDKSSYIRLLKIDLTSPKTGYYTLNWQSSDHSLQQASVNINLPAVIPTLSWGVNSILLHPIMIRDADWYLSPQIKYAEELKRQYKATKNITKNTAKEWLYDRPRIFWQIFLMTGDPVWKKQQKNT